MQMTPLVDAGALFAVDGELDAYTGPQLREQLGQALSEGVRWLFVDLSGVEYMDSVGLGILVGMAKRASEVAGGVAVIGPRPNVRRVFDVSGTQVLLNVVDDLPEAENRLRPACQTGEEA
jgi:anti-sigma B factor antagonist